MSQKPPRYSKQDIEINAAVYDSFLKVNLEDGWTRFDKIGNFHLLIGIQKYTHTSLSGSSCLDVGCGTGDLAPYLAKFEVKQYLGIDIFAPAVARAQFKFPKYHFIVGDFLDYQFDQKFDFVFCSGALTTKLDSDNYQIFETWIKKMWDLSIVGVALNILIEEYKGQSLGDLFLYDRNRVLQIITNILPEAQLKILTTNAGGGNTIDELHIYLYRG